MDFFKIISAIKAGEELKSAATWSNAQSLTNILAALATAGVSIARGFGWEIPLSDEQLTAVVGAAGTILFVANSVLSIMTTKDAGLK